MWVEYVLDNRSSHGTTSMLLDITLSSKLDRDPSHWYAQISSSVSLGEGYDF